MNAVEIKAKERFNRYKFNQEIRKVREIFSDFRFAGLRSGWLQKEHDLFMSDHLAQRIVERNLLSDVPWICKMTKHFMMNEFYKTTWQSRDYTIQLKDLKLGISISKGANSEHRQAIAKTAYNNDTDYEPDQRINLKFNS